jgi:DNA polymerase III epsilon subunit-like protein
MPNCQKKKGYLYKQCLYSHIILEHESDPTKAKIIFDKMITEIITQNNLEKSKQRNVLYSNKPELIQKTIFNSIPIIKNYSNYNLLIYDCETTGFNKNLNGICEISCYSYLYDTQISSLFNPNVQGFNWEEKAQKINNIDYNKVKDKPFINFFCNDFVKWATNDGKQIPIILAHNCAFDKRFFDKTFQNFSIKNPDFFWLDSIGFFKQSVIGQKTKKSFSLENLRKNFLDGNNLILHGASNDVFVLKELLIKVFGSLQNLFEYSTSIFEKKEPKNIIKKLKIK